MTESAAKFDHSRFAKLQTVDGLAELDERFLAVLPQQLRDVLLAYRDGANQSALQTSELLLEVSPYLEKFIADFFDIEKIVQEARDKLLANDPIFLFKKHFVLRLAKRKINKVAEMPSYVELDAWLASMLQKFSLQLDDKELATAKLAEYLLTDEEKYTDEIEQLVAFCTRVLTDSSLQQAYREWVSFRLPQHTDYQKLVDLEPLTGDPWSRWQGPVDQHRQRDGFELTDQRMSQREILSEIDYCVYCHKNEGDFCSKGFPVKKNQPELGLKKNLLDEVMTGCPLEEKISEMHVLKKQGYGLAALAMIMVDNPMCAVTGHRICNDCMKACIYQKQDPVDIPQIETGVLTDVLALPWGAEIYLLFMRWNPLRNKQWLPKPYSGRKVMIMGMGPAGFTLAHHLLMEGCAVVGADGLKIEPLSDELVQKPICEYASLTESLDERFMLGFGGVAEYGITVRWDKNFLKLIYLSLLRREHFQIFGGVRFGGTIQVEDAWELGFDHLALAVGAGLPRELAIPGSMAPGMRQANDFLMALQLTGAAQESSLANLQLRLPAVIIGGGLTGVDTATEAQAYYIKQVEKTLHRYEKVSAVLGEARVLEHFEGVDLEILEEFLAHGREVKLERSQALREKREPNFIQLIRDWGGVSIVYRRLMNESPAYKRNHEELIKALEEGVFYAEGLQPIAARLDRHGHVEALVCEENFYDENEQWMMSDHQRVMPAKSILVATGAKPNIAYEFEHRGTFQRVGMEYQPYSLVDNKLQALDNKLERHSKMPVFGPFTSYAKDNRRVTFLGDTHPVFHGSVVKAIASAKRIYPHIIENIASPRKMNDYDKFSDKIRNLFNATVVEVKRHSPSVIEITVSAPQAAKHFKPGQFYRLQNFATTAEQIEGTRLQTEALALLAAEVDRQQGHVVMMVYEQGASSRLVQTFSPGDAISLMGPTGVRTKIPDDQETVMIIGDQLSIGYTRSVGKALRAAGNKVLYVACLDSLQELHCREELYEAADAIVWLTRLGESAGELRPQDISASGEFMPNLLRYAMGELSVEPSIPLSEIQRVQVVGSSDLVKAVQSARGSSLREYFVDSIQFFASIYGPMQCMLKGVCAQCLQWQIDPETGQRTKAVYTCSWQDQPIEIVDLHNLDERLAQNASQEILTNLWLDYLFLRKTGV